MAASRARCGFSLCSRLARTRSTYSARSSLLDTYRLGRPLYSINTIGLAATLSSKHRSSQFSTTSLVSCVATTNSTVAEDPGSRPASIGGGIPAAESEDDDDPFINEQMKIYKRICRWVAVIMGENPETFTEKDVKEALEYLFPSSLYAKDARPRLLHPADLQRIQKDRVFDQTGRPKFAAFYTGNVAYHDLIFDIYTQLEKLEQNDWPVVSKPIEVNKQQNNEQNKVNEKPFRWINKLELEKRLETSLKDREFEVVIHRLKKIASHPNAVNAWEFLKDFVIEVYIPGTKQVLQELDEDGRAHAIGHRKTAIAEVWVKKGSGKITVNDQPFVKYFFRVEDRQQVLFPFHVVNGVGEYDADCNVIGGGPTGQAGAVRLAISRALLHFSLDYQAPLMEAGLLMRDSRIVERKKVGQKKARKKFTWRPR